MLTVHTGATATISGLTISGGTHNEGGGIFAVGSLTVESSTISGNTGGAYGGGIYARGSLTVESSTISGNRATLGGGGIYNATSAVVASSTISGNTAEDGGGIYNTRSAAALVATSTISGNTASIAGGGVYNTTAALTLESSTISGNTATNHGGGIYNFDTTTQPVRVESSTISGNGASPGTTGAGIYLHEGVVTLAASIVAKQRTAGPDCTVNDTRDSGTASPDSPTILSNAGYDVADQTGCGFSATSSGTATHHSVVSAAIDNYLGTLGNHGGSAQTVPLLSSPTPSTSAPDPARASIPASTTLTVASQRYAACATPAENGVARNTGAACDAGAFELSFTPPATRSFRRIYGPTAQGTAARELESAFPGAVGTCPGSASTRPALLATDAGYADALSSSYLAGALGTGTLLTTPSKLSSPTVAALQEEGITHVDVVGGPLAVSTAVVRALEAMPATACGGGQGSGAHISVTRIYGATELGTAQKIATLPGLPVGTADLAAAYGGTNHSGGQGRYNATAGSASTAASGPGALRTAVLASGAGFQDATSAAVMAYASHLPLVLTAPGSLSAQSATALGTLHIAQVVLMGGPLAVSDSVVSSLQGLGISVLRVAGATAPATATELAQLELGSAASHLGTGWRPTGGVTVARGDYWSDGLAGAVVAAHGQGAGLHPEPLLLTQSPAVPGQALDAFLAQAGAQGIDRDAVPITALTVLGGPLAVTNSAVSSMEAALSR